MKKVVLVGMTLTSMLFAKTLTEQQEESLVRGIIPNTKIEKISRAEIDGFYKAYLANGNLLYINPFKRVIFIGEIYTATGTSLTENDMVQWKNELSSNTLKEVKVNELLKNAQKLVYNKGSLKYDFVVFTDPQCPYCAKAEEFLESKNATVYVNFFPLPFHKDAKRWSEQILSSKDIKSAMKQLRLSQKDLDIQITKKAQNTLEATMKLGEKLKIAGTPKIFIVDRANKKVVDIIDGANLRKIQEILDKDRQ